MVDIQYATAVRRGKKERENEKKKPQDENITSASATQGGYDEHIYMAQNKKSSGALVVRT